MVRVRAIVASVALLATLGAGTALASPANVNTRYIPGADCDGQSVDLATMQGAAAWDVATGRVFVLMGLTVDGVWAAPIPKGQAKADLSTCSYDNFGPHIVIYGMWVTPH
jgi:hypothetical protein